MKNQLTLLPEVTDEEDEKEVVIVRKRLGSCVSAQVIYVFVLYIIFSFNRFAFTECFING